MSGVLLTQHDGRIRPATFSRTIQNTETANVAKPLPEEHIMLGLGSKSARRKPPITDTHPEDDEMYKTAPLVSQTHGFRRKRPTL